MRLQKTVKPMSTTQNEQHLLGWAQNNSFSTQTLHMRLAEGGHASLQPNIPQIYFSLIFIQRKRSLETP